MHSQLCYAAGDFCEEDFNECSTSADLCSMKSSECMNTFGGFLCHCAKGYVEKDSECKGKKISRDYFCKFNTYK